MNLDKAISNIDQVIANAPMTRYDHDELKSNLAFLVTRAKVSDKLQERIDVLENEITKLNKTTYTLNNNIRVLEERLEKLAKKEE